MVRGANLKVITGGPDSGPMRGSYLPTGVTDDKGNPFYKYTGGTSSGGGGGDGVTPIWKLDVHRDVQLAKWGVVGLATVFLGALWFLLAQIDGRFDRADGKISIVSDKVADLRVEIAGQRGDIKTLLDKVDGQSQTGPGTGQTGSIHQGKGGGSRP